VLRKGGELRFGHPSGGFTLRTEPKLDTDPNKIAFKTLTFRGPRGSFATAPSTSRKRPVRPWPTWTEADEVTAASFFMLGDNISVQR